jgi:hypothetical protein
MGSLPAGGFMSLNNTGKAFMLLLIIALAIAGTVQAADTPSVADRAGERDIVRPTVQLTQLPVQPAQLPAKPEQLPVKPVQLPVIPTPAPTPIPTPTPAPTPTPTPPPAQPVQPPVTLPTPPPLQPSYPPPIYYPPVYVPIQSAGSILATSNPSGAAVYVDGRYEGSSDRAVGDLYYGTHTIVFEKSGYQTWTKIVTVYSGETTEVYATLTPISGYGTGELQVSSIPPDAGVYLNGGYLGVTSASGPVLIQNLNPGTSTIIFMKSGYQDYTTTEQISAGSITRVSAVLQPASLSPSTGTAEFISSPGGAQVKVNNAYLGITPLTLRNVRVDPSILYTVTLDLDGYQTYTRTGSFSPGQKILIDAALTPVSQPSPSRQEQDAGRFAGGAAVVFAGILIAYYVMVRKKSGAYAGQGNTGSTRT